VPTTPAWVVCNCFGRTTKKSNPETRKAGPWMDIQRRYLVIAGGEAEKPGRVVQMQSK
jgi:hypothetical protein